jgi:adenylosuccinate lyase
MKEGEEADLVERIAADPAFGIDEGGIRTLMDPRRFVGRAPEQVDAFLRDWVAPVLERRLEAAMRLAAPEVRV